MVARCSVHSADSDPFGNEGGGMECLPITFGWVATALHEFDDDGNEYVGGR